MDCLELQIPPLPQFITVGQATWIPGTQHPARTFNVYDLLIVTRGLFYMTEEDVVYELGEGGILLLEPGKHHSGHQPVQVETDVFWLHFSHPSALRTVQHEQIQWSSLLRKGTDHDVTPPVQTIYLPKFTHLNVKSIIPLMKELNETHHTLSLRNALRLHHLTIDLLQRLQGLVGATVHSRSYQLSEQIIDYLSRNSTNSFSATHMEQEFHFHFDYLARCLKQYTGMSPIQYYHHVKLERVRMLLLQSDQSIQEIADQAGFTNANYCIRLFRKHYGITPGAYRSQFKDRV